MATSRVPATIDALAASWTAAGLKTWDGAVVTGDYTDAVYLGYDGDPQGDFLTVEPDQNWAGIGAKKRDEEFAIICAAVALLGGGTTKTARDTVFAMLATVENELRADPSLGQPPPFVAEYKGGPIFTEPGPDGYQVRAVFSVHVKTRV